MAYFFIVVGKDLINSLGFVSFDGGGGGGLGGVGFGVIELGLEPLLSLIVFIFYKFN